MAQRSVVPQAHARPPVRAAVELAGVVRPFPAPRARAPGRRAWRVLGNAAFTVVSGLALAVGVVSVGPRFLPYQMLPVLTGSMEPAIPTGALAVVVPVRGDELVPGDVITFHHPRDPRAYVTHRIAAIEEDGGARAFVTKGDANALPDAWRVMDTGTGWRYAFAVPAVGAVVAGVGSSPLHSAVFALSLLALAAIALHEIWRPRPHEVSSRPRAA